jgi:hypothetical protein
MSTVLSLRRPATSHQRSAGIELLTNFNTDTDYTEASDTFQDLNLREKLDAQEAVDDTWRPYFLSRQDEPWDRFRGRASAIIKPQDQLGTHADYPTLMLSTSITPRDLNNKSTARKRPSFSVQSKVHESFARPAANQIDHLTSPAPKEKRKPRQSSSFNDMFNIDSNVGLAPRKGSIRSKTQTSKSPVKARNVSNPLPQHDAEQLAGPRLRRKRNFTDPSVFRRPQTAPHKEHSKSNHAHSRIVDVDLAYSVESHGRTDLASSYAVRSTEDNTVSPITGQDLGSSPPVFRYSRVKRLSVTTSDRASTVIGSDDTRVFTSGDEDDQSDSVFDSFRTRITSSSHSGRRGPNIETIFQEVSPTDLKQDRVALEDLKPRKSHLPQLTPRSSSSLSNLDSESTPVTVSRARKEEETPTPSGKIGSRDGIPSSPLDSFESEPVRPGESSIVDDKRDESRPYLDPASPVLRIEPEERGKKSEARLESEPSDVTSDVDIPSLTRKTSGLGIKASVFDWSEQPRTERDVQETNYRPSTVHGKQGTTGRDSRVPGRKPPTAMHLRSQSVPVSRESPPSNDNRQSSLKFGTWGLGHKGVSEDWDGDFDFGDSDGLSATEGTTVSDGQPRYIMKVPQAIMESQASVHGQFGQVQELTLLVEELKRLRLQGNMLRIVQGQSNELWKEADGIVNLATFEDDENSFPPSLSLSSRASFDDLESSPSPPQKAKKRTDSDARRPPLAIWPNPGANSSPPRRREPAQKAKSVLETIYAHRGSSEPHSLEPYAYSQQKVSFDTQSLRDLVVRAGVVTRALKDVIRRAEGVATISEVSSNADPPLSRMFDQTT